MNTKQEQVKETQRMSYCRWCGGADRRHFIVPTDYASKTIIMQCARCGHEKEVRA